jgi:hypothetical protein
LPATLVDGCGTGRYFPLITGAGTRVADVDQSAGMLAQVRSRNLTVSLEHCRLQDLSCDGEFDAAVTIDALENVPPEDYPAVLANPGRGRVLGWLAEAGLDVIDEGYRAEDSRGYRHFLLGAPQ